MSQYPLVLFTFAHLIRKTFATDWTLLPERIKLMLVYCNLDSRFKTLHLYSHDILYNTINSKLYFLEFHVTMPYGNKALLHETLESRKYSIFSITKNIHLT